MGYYRFLFDHPMFVNSEIPWSTTRNGRVAWKKWLESEEVKSLPYSSDLFWKGAYQEVKSGAKVVDKNESDEDFDEA